MFYVDITSRSTEQLDGSVSVLAWMAVMDRDCTVDESWLIAVNGFTSLSLG